ncbi:hypothetical protein ACJDU8_16975 [Clostridium sp. WILCCON 0269]|uniref:DUF5673 domain-containing protein n=1 Tax=Candidatus Clostridium eludens TaxID=3381663 RepID=A0ABW8SNJ7_9CLOT
MDKVNKDDLIKSLKMFCTTFIFVVLIYIITTKFLYGKEKITLDRVSLCAFSISLGSSVGYFKRYKKYSTKIMFKEISNENIVVELQEIMKNMHWSIQNINSNHMVFKSSPLRTFLTEYLIMNINDSTVELTGPQYYVEKILERLQK